MKKNLFLLVLSASAMLCACSKDTTTCDEVQQPSRNSISNVETPTSRTFAQTRQIVADVLGEEVAAQITPTSRYIKVEFLSVDQMIEEVTKKDVITYLSTPLFGEAVQTTTQEDKPNPMYALVDRDVPLPEGAACEVLAEYCDPESPLSGLTAEQTLAVMQAIVPQSPQTKGAYDWTPTGRIEIRDDLAGVYIPVANIKITLTGYKAGSTTALQVETVTTNSEGRFTATKQFNGPVAKNMLWKNNYWTVMSDAANVAFTSAMQDRVPWNLIISTATANRALQFASAYRAANYMHNNGYPISNGTTSTSTVQIRCFNEVVPSGSDDSFYQNSSDANTMIVLIYCGGKSALDIYNAVNREVGKAVQQLRINATTNNYTSFHKTIIDSWGEFTKFYFAEQEYRGLNALTKLHTYTLEYPTIYTGSVPKPDNLNGQGWFYNTQLAAINQCKSPMFIDLYDNFNQKVWPLNFTQSYVKYPTDKLTLTLAEFSDYVTWSRTCKTTAELKQKCIQAVGPDMPQVQAIDNLFPVYLELEAAL